MSVFSSLCADVYTLTNRPDYVGETALAVKAATLKAHASDSYFKDLFETGIVFTPADYLQTIDYRVIAPKYRALKYLRKFDVPSNTPGKFFKIKTPDDVVDDYGKDLLDIAYVAGSVIQVKSSTLITNALFGCYIHPTVDSDATFNSWIANEYPYAIIYEAAAIIFGMLENIKARDFYRGMAIEYTQSEVKSHNVVASGY